MSFARVVLPLVLGMASGGCASSGQAPVSGPFTESGEEDSVRIEVLNLNFQNARLYAISPGRRTLLGTARGKENSTFTLDWEIPTLLQIEIDLLAGPRCITEAIQMDPGDILEVRIASVFSQSSCR